MMNDKPVIPPWLDSTLILPIPEMTLEEVKIAMMFSTPATLLGQTVARDFPGAKNWRVKGYPAISKLRRLKSKAAYRHNPANKPKIVAKIKECKDARRDEARAFVKRWKECNADKVKAQKARAANRKYDTRPFVCIDSEGKFTGKTIIPMKVLQANKGRFFGARRPPQASRNGFVITTRGRLAHMKFANGFARCLENSGKRIT
jgi:hypothetical protein